MLKPVWAAEKASTIVENTLTSHTIELVMTLDSKVTNSMTMVTLTLSLTACLATQSTQWSYVTSDISLNIRGRLLIFGIHISNGPLTT